MKDKRETIKSEFKYYLSNVARSARRTSEGFNLGKTAVDSFMSFIEPERLFDYAPEKWRHIKSLYDVTTPNEVKQIADSLLNDSTFIAHDASKNQGWRSGAISHYVCFINARSFFRNEEKETIPFHDEIIFPLQQIVYGAPGTGKSFGVDEDVKKHGMQDIRTTFHPDSDYSTFVGAYKPQMEKVTVRDDHGFPVKENGQVVYEKKIVYKYTQQAFLKAYIAAWKDLENPHVLVIEEINRGNCAQIFGDLFQLLDRNDIGFSKYPITADTDIMQVLNEEFDGLQVANSEAINTYYKDDVVTDVLNGSRLLLPNNLYIWATMNTSDQSLFPIDSAFKRRWEWKYVPISDAGKSWKICVNGTEYDWWSFVEKINNKIWGATHSEDKKLGYFFCKADRKSNESDEENNVISADRFVGKALFYIYNDVFKDYGFDDAIFKDKEDGNSDLLFQCYFMANGKPNEEKIEVFLKNLEVKLASEVEEKNDDYVSEESEEDYEEIDENDLNDNGVSDTNSPYKVTFPDGEVICEEYGWDTYIAALRKIGLDKALPFGQIFTRKNKSLPLITDKKIPDQGTYKYIKIDGYYVLSGTDSQHRLLKKMNKDLGLGLIIE